MNIRTSGRMGDGARLWNFDHIRRKNRRYYYKSIALWEYFWYYIKAFRTGTDFPPCGRASRLGGGVEVPGGKNKYLEEMKCQ